MKPLEKLPCWVVIRLCTDDDRIVKYWNNIDSQLELDMDVLDDFASEATEIMQVNSWLVYGEPLHKLREWGVNFKELDLLDEAPLSADQMRFTCAMLLFGMATSELPHPSENWSAFEQLIISANKETPQVWNPVSRRMSNWVSISGLKKRYGPTSSCAIM